MRTRRTPRRRGPIVAALGLIVAGLPGCDTSGGMPAQGSISLPKKEPTANAEPNKGGAAKSPPKGRPRVSD